MRLYEADSEVVDSEDVVRQPTYRVTRLCLISFSCRKDRWLIGSEYSSTIGVFLVVTREGSQLINSPKTLPFDDFKPSDLLDFIRRGLRRLALLPLRVSAIFPRKLCARFILYAASGRAEANRI